MSELEQMSVATETPELNGYWSVYRQSPEKWLALPHSVASYVLARSHPAIRLDFSFLARSEIWLALPHSVASYVLARSHPATSSFYRSGSQALNHGLLQEQEHNHHGNRRQHRTRHDGAPVGESFDVLQLG